MNRRYRKTIIAGNWKMNKTAAETVELCKGLKEKFADVCPCKAEVAVCPPFTSIAAAIEELKGSNIKVGAQNIHWADNGAFTGEISGAMLKEMGVEYVIIGHSERRQYFGETDETVNKRLQAALKYELKPIVCIGETLSEREGNQTEAVLEKQIRAGVAGDGELRRDQQLCALSRRLPRGLQDLFRVIPAVRQTQLRRHGRNLNKSILHGKQLLSGPAPAWPGAFWFLL